MLHCSGRTKAVIQSSESQEKFCIAQNATGGGSAEFQLCKMITLAKLDRKMAEQATGSGPSVDEARISRLPFPDQVDVRAIEGLRPLLLTRWAELAGKLGQLGNEPPLIFLSAAVLAVGVIGGRPALRRAAVRMATAHFFTILFKEWGKNHVDRSRPEEQLKDGHYHRTSGHSKDPDLRSFPSGHTAGAVAVARAFSRDVPHYARPAQSAAALIGLLQIVRRAHYPGDIIVGGLGGVAAEKIASFAIDRLKVPGFGRNATS